MKRYISYGKNFLTYFGSSLIPMVLNLAINPLVAMNMSPEDYAISGYYTSFTSLISPIIIFYMVHYYIKEYFRRDEAQRINLFALIAKATIWFSGLISIFCFVGLIAYFKLSDSELSIPISPYLALMVFSLPLTGLLNLQLAQYRMEKAATAYFRLSVGNGVLNILNTVLFVVLLKWGAFGKLLGPLLCNATIFLLMLYKFRHILRIKTSVKEFRAVFFFCLPLALSAMLGYFTQGFSTTYLESVGQVTEYGIYVVGVSIGGYLTVFGSAVGNTFQPDLYENTIKRQWRRYALFCFMQIGLLTIIVLIFIICSPWIISMLTAGRYTESTPFAQIVSIGTVTSAVYYLVNNYSIATNRPRLYLFTSIIGSALVVSVMPWAVDRWEFYGGAWVGVLSFVAFAIINMVLLWLVPQKMAE